MSQSALPLERYQKLIGSIQQHHFLPSMHLSPLLKVTFFPGHKLDRPWTDQCSKTRLFNCFTENIQPALCMLTCHFSIALLQCVLMYQTLIGKSELWEKSNMHPKKKLLNENVWVFFCNHKMRKTKCTWGFGPAWSLFNLSVWEVLKSSQMKPRY